MLRIRKLKSAKTRADRQTVAEIQEILRAQFPGMSEEMIAKLPRQLEDPLASGFVSELFVAEVGPAAIGGFAIVLFMPDLHFAYLDTIATAPGRTGRGIGAALYEEVREEARSMTGTRGLFFECLPDDPALSPDPRIRRQNAARLRFYERFGALPIIGTAYETPLAEGETDPPYLMFDGLGRYRLPGRSTLATIVEAILRRKYGDLCPEDYIARVVASVRKGKPQLRPPRHAVAAPEAPPPVSGLTIPLFVNDRHQIHHVRERGYVEAPVRIDTILRAIEPMGLFARREARSFPERWIREVHDAGLVDYLRTACAEVPEGKAVYPYVFPVRNPHRRPKERSVLAGYWCIDTFTPITRNAEPAARHAVDCALSAAEAVREGARAAYALVRPPGHHAERRSFGGFCYYANAAIAANYLSKQGRVAILDIDYHHGNSQQDIFYERDDVLTVSIHGHPSFAYPYFTGFANETGRGRGAGFNLNLPLPETVSPEEHRAAIARALRRIARFAPDFLVLALGLDTARGDPTGTWSNRPADFHEIGRMIGAAGLPTVAVQEGGYRIGTLGLNARAFFAGLAEGLAATPPRRRAPAGAKERREPELAWRTAVRAEDAAAIRALVAATGMFSAAEVDIAAELVEERVARGTASGYEFVIAEADGALLGYACWGPTPGTQGTCDLYWIVTAPQAQRRGIGRALLQRVIAAARQAGGRLLVAETSGRADYAPTRAFYRASGFRLAARLADFYAPGDDKLILTRELAAEA
ncbi:GNAT family N-acetyltransferase [Albidovulum sp.]